ncbi:Alpha/Beta hydrolase protein, partial [Mycena rosella]
AASYSLHVNTASGTLHGFIDCSAPAVRQFIGVPFALPPTGSRRWLPPAPKISPTAIMNATSFGLSDCLTPNVWAPAQPQSAMLPVIVWFFGGGFTQGGTDSLYFNAAPWVQCTQAHIVNLGLLDQRAALEWVRDNAAAFGGEAARIAAWGESAGAIAVDYLNFAFYEDPIVTGFIMDSATALFPERVKTTDTAQANFAAVAAELGCGGGAPAAQIDCLRDTVLAANASLSFLSVPDDRLVFANYTTSYGAGLLAHLPLIFGTAGQFHGPSTAYEDKVSGRLQDLWLAFAQDPEKGLQNAGWDTFGAGKAVLLGDADTPMKEVDVQELDGACAKK